MRAVGLHVHTLDMSAFKSMRRGQRLRAVAEAVVESCPEAAMWLQQVKTANATEPLEEQMQEANYVKAESGKFIEKRVPSRP